MSDQGQSETTRVRTDHLTRTATWPPQQPEGKTKDVGPPDDLYALEAILYFSDIALAHREL
jgi:hypothetical protein